MLRFLIITYHFIKCVQGRDKSDPILVLYDGHRSHISIDLIEWAQSQNIVVFVLPPHTSHVLQPMDVGCFGHLQVKYSQECTSFVRLNHRVVSRYNVCGLVCKAYGAALYPLNMQSAFQKSGNYPLVMAVQCVNLWVVGLHPQLFTAL